MVNGFEFLSPEDRRDELRAKAIKEARIQFHRQGGLWVNGALVTWANAYEIAFWSVAYGEWDKACKAAETARELERLAKQHQRVLQGCLHDAITQIAAAVVDQTREDDA